MGLSRSFFANKNTIISILFVFIFSCNSQNNGLSDAAEDDLNDNNSSTNPVPTNYELIRQDDFGFFDKTNWSKGLIHDADESIRMIWNKNTGGEHLLNDNYDGYLLDNNVYVSDGLLFLENRTNKLIINKTNKNDVINIIGQPHTKSIDNDNEWIYIERTFNKGEYHKLGQHILKSNNVLFLEFNKYGILKNKKLFKKEDLKKLSFSKSSTENDLSKRSFVEKLFSSLKAKMYGIK